MTPPASLDAAAAARFLRVLPALGDSIDLGVATAPVEPWPHQLAIVRRSVARYPQSFLFCDEVGLGKTITVGLCLRQLVVAGRVRRALVLVPKAVLRQWQEELSERAGLDIPRLEGGRLLDRGDRRMGAVREALAAEASLLLASTQWARRRAQRDLLLGAPLWDLVIVDEAHHARRAWTAGVKARPNRLLELLGGGDPTRPLSAEGLRARTRCLYLLTATPLQVHPLELWELMRLLGVGGRWGGDPEAFLRYFTELERPPGARDAGFLRAMLFDAVRSDLFTEATLRDVLPPELHDALRTHPEKADAAFDRLDAEQRERAWRRLHPVAAVVWRTTRDELRASAVPGTVPRRRPINVWLPLEPAQQDLYRRVEDYLAHAWARAEAHRPGLGFVLTVYRRRLTSSLEALRRSLLRRWTMQEAADAVGDRGTAPAHGDPDEVMATAEDAGRDAPSQRGRQGQLFTLDLAERAQLGDLLERLSALDGDEPKIVRLGDDLEQVLERGAKALVFTQYLDTLDHVRARLLDRLGDRAAEIGCWSGRGAERFADGAWRRLEKRALRNAVAAGDVHVLLCTEAAAEGLNLQSCGVLINFDLPWNPMRVEQRIGRIDRIGQRHAEIEILNYFYRDTVEAEIYQRLADRIGWFERVLGRLQPILHRVGETIERLAMLPPSARRRPMAEALAALDASRDDDVEILDVAASREVVNERPSIPEPPIAPAPAAEDVGALLAAAGVLPADSAAPTWPRLDALLAEAGAGATTSSEPVGVGLYRSEEPWPVALALVPDRHAAQGVRRLATLEEFQRVWSSAPGAWTAAEEAAASSLLSSERRAALWAVERVERARRRAGRGAVRSETERLVARWLGMEAERARDLDLFADAQERPPSLVALIERLDRLPAAESWRPQAVGGPRTVAAQAARLESQAVELLDRWRTLDAAEIEAERRLHATTEARIERIFLAPAGRSVDAGERGRHPVTEPRWQDADAVTPFVDALPFLGDLRDAGDRWLDALHTGGDFLAGLAREPHAVNWLAGTERRTVVVRLDGRALEPDLPLGALVMLRVEAPRRPPVGHLLVLHHPELSDPETGASILLRRVARRRGQLVLEAQGADSMPLAEPESLRVLGRVLGLWTPPD
ncbi:MAG: SNF2-related protein [Acidobacteriota bacterium]